MNRYGSSKRIGSINSKIIMDQQEFEEAIQQPVPLVDVRFKSIPSSKMLIAEAQAIEYQKKRKQPTIEQLKITQTQSAQKLRINNFFGSNKTLQRKFDTGIQQQLNPQNRQRRQFSEDEDNHDRLAKLIQKQIQERNKWEKQAQQNQVEEELDQNHLTNEFNSEISKEKNALLVNNVQSFHKVQSRNKLSKVGSDKFLNHVEKNKLFQSKGQDIEYLKPAQDKPSIQQQQQDKSPQMEKKKRSVSQLKPLKKKLSTYEVLNQLDMYKKKDPQTLETQIKTPVKTMNISKSRIIGLDIPNLLAFNKQVIPKSKYIEGTLRRNRSGIDNTFWPEYRLIFDEMSIIYAKKTVKGYDISMDPNSQKYGFQPKLGSVKGNFVGSYYNLYSGFDQSEILATIFYNPDSKEITTEVQLYIKNEQIQYKNIDRDNQKDTDANLQVLYSQGQNRAQGKIRKFINKKPHFDQKTKMYKLDFGGKAPIPSVKNTILIDAQTQRDKILTVGKWGSDHFYIRAEYPLSPLILMGYLMSSFNFKFVTQ